MSSRRHQQPSRSETAALYQTVRGLSSDGKKSPQEKEPFGFPGFGTPRSWCYGIVACLTTATLFLNGDGLIFEGDGLFVALAWQLLAAILLLTRWHQKKPLFSRSQTDASQKSPFTFFDLAACLFFGWVALSFLMIWFFGSGSPRNMLTMMTHWGSFAAMFVTWRLLLNCRTMVRGMMLLFVAMAVAESSVAYYEYFYEMPGTRREYFADSEKYLKANNIQTPGDRELFENRIKNPEPLGTYSLTNSLAGVLVPWVIFLLGVMLFGRHETNTSLKRNAVLLCFFVIVGLVFLATKSRSSLIASVLGAFFFGLHFLTSRVRNRRVVSGVLVGLTVCLLVGAGITFAVGVLDREMINRASLSFGYRVQYWESSSRMIADHPFFGCGIGNFKESYPFYKLPTASETISDPHNLFFEVASNAGLPALLFLVVLLFGVLFRIVFLKPELKQEQSSMKQARDNPSQWSRFAPFLFGGVAGLFLAVVQSLFNAVFISPEWFGFGLLGFLLAGVLLLPVFTKSEFPLKVIVPTCLVVLVVNLLAAGGIAFPHVNMAFWFLLAICLHVIESNHPVPGSCKNTVKMSLGFPKMQVCFLGIGLIFLVGAIMLYLFAFLPNFRASEAYKKYAVDPTQSATIGGRISALEKIVRDDPWRTGAWTELCGMYLLERREYPESMQRRSVKENWRFPIGRLPFVKDKERFEKTFLLEQVIANALEKGLVSSPR
ncbi:MAG: O-antigen ligase family protein, partial [Planctomycetaceae bacterium]|nr:O-antigen ligase family protein [Planctomycetaceae bacterium]